MQSSSCTNGAACIDVEERGGFFYIRNTGNTSTSVLATSDEWEAFIRGVKAGEFDALTQGSAESAPLDVVPETVTAQD